MRSVEIWMFVNKWQHLFTWQDIKIQLNLQIWQIALSVVCHFEQYFKGKMESIQVVFYHFESYWWKHLLFSWYCSVLPHVQWLKKGKKRSFADWVLVFATLLSEIHADYIMFLQGLIVCIIERHEITYKQEEISFWEEWSVRNETGSLKKLNQKLKESKCHYKKKLEISIKWWTQRNSGIVLKQL